MGNPRSLKFCALTTLVEMPETTYDSLDAHLPLAEDIASASVPMGLLLAWCANMHLLSGPVVQEHERLILRVRFEEATGSELLIACGGALSRELFSQQGQRFLDDFYPGYMDMFRCVFGDDCYAVKDNTDNYRKLAKMLTQRYMGKVRPQRNARTGLIGKLTNWFRS